MSHFKLGWKGKTRSGVNARIVATDAAGHTPLVVLYKEGATENARNLRTDGTWWGPEHPHALDLMPRTKEVTRWVNVYPRSWMDGIHETQEEADRCCTPERVACIPITFTIPDDEGSDGK